LKGQLGGGGAPALPNQSPSPASLDDTTLELLVSGLSGGILIQLQVAGDLGYGNGPLARLVTENTTAGTGG
jgi:hypothetical protein